MGQFFRTWILLDEDILAGKHRFNDFAFEVDELECLELTDDGLKVIDKVMFFAASDEVRLPYSQCHRSNADSGRMIDNALNPGQLFIS